jgi:hypothetical protein
MTNVTDTNIHSACDAEITRLRRLVEHFKSLKNGYADALQELAGAIPIDNSYGDSALMQALGQAHLVLQEGPQ